MKAYDLAEKEFRYIWKDMIVGLRLGRDKRVKKAYNKRCQDELTLILTKRGWLRYDEVQIGDWTLSINPSTGLSEWDQVQAVNIYPGEHAVTRMESRTFSALGTPEHKWLTYRDGRRGLTPGWMWRQTNQLTQADKIPKALPCATLPTEPKYTDAFVELVAWIWTEGGLNNHGKSFNIHQSHIVNPDNVVRIRRALQELCPEPVRGSRWNPSEYWSELIADNAHKTMTIFSVGTELSKMFWPVFKSHKVVDPEFIASLTQAQLRLFVDVSVLGDGHDSTHKPNGQKNVAQENLEQLFAVQLACSLLGVPTSVSYNTVAGGWYLYLHREGRSVWVNPKQAEAAGKKRPSAENAMCITNETYIGNVWCPTTKNGTWLASRNGKVYYTGNSGEMYVEFPWGTRLECRSAKHPETLVGDGLHGVIMSEAAKHTKETWEQYIRAALSDYHGWATFVSTPEGFSWFYDLWMLGLDNAFPDFQSWRFPSWENPIVYPQGREDSEIKLIESTTALEWFMQEYGAEFGAFLGKIYGEFDPHLHILRDPYKFNPEWANYIAFDPGFTNPFAAIEFQVDPWDRVYVWREHYRTHLTLTEHIAIMKRREQPEGYHLDLGFSDAADPEGAMAISTDFVGTYAMPEAKKNWREGIDLVKTFLRPRDVYSPGGNLVVCDEYGTPQQEPWLYIDPSCKNLIREFNNYRTVNSRPEVNPRESAKNFDDHALDALRYGLMHIFKLGCTHHLSDVYEEEINKKYEGILDEIPQDVGGFFTTTDLTDF